ncbi:MAG TPA: thermostable hemolysin [Magnetospirillum sp.]|nr:thermostable hemolysin [Magnetospirillum sp.]
MTLIMADRNHPLRGLLERTVGEVFHAEFGARVPCFPNRLVASLTGDGAPQAVAGLRFAEDGFFSEAYLDTPIETALTAAIGRPVARGGVVEFSSLAAPRPGAAMPLIGWAIRLSLAHGGSVGLFTATRRLRTLLRRTGLECLDLGPARPERLADASPWGSYYLHDPRVMAVSADCLAALRPTTFPERRHA